MTDYYLDQQNQKTMLRRSEAVLVKLEKAKLKHKELQNAIDIFIGTGSSGISVASILFARSEQPASWGFIRKDTDTKHHGDKYELPPIVYKRDPKTDKRIDVNVWLADDFICTGSTMQRLLDGVTDANEGRPCGIITLGGMNRWDITDLINRPVWKMSKPILIYGKRRR